MFEQQVSSILCFDFDGTLVDPEGGEAFCHELMEDVQALKGEGAVWGVNSGRSLFQVLEGLQSHGIPLVPDFIIAQESEIYRLGGFNRWVDFGDWNKRCVQDHRKFFRSTGRFFKRVRNFVETTTEAQYFPSGDGPAGVLARSDDEMESICEFIELESRKVPALGYQRNGLHLRFCHAEYHKGSALGELGRLLNMDPEFMFAAGDNHNDLSMLDGEYARAVACPANAVPEVKEAVAEQGGYVAEASFSAGMLEAVRYYYF
ncbi:MAG: HAD hydrolase family protein [Verrucomicrobiota bacterium]